MRRLLLAALPLAFLAGAAACGDGPDRDDASAEVTPTLTNGDQPQVPDKPLPSPTPIPDNLPVVQVVVAGKSFAPTRSEFNTLPKVAIDAAGTQYEGVTLAVLAEKAGAKPGATATIQGTRTDNLRLGAIRFPLAEIGASTVFVIDDGGHVLLASASIPKEQWLKDVTGISLN